MAFMWQNVLNNFMPGLIQCKLIKFLFWETYGLFAYTDPLVQQNKTFLYYKNLPYIIPLVWVGFMKLSAR
jgi:hypothetical protein